MTGWFRGMRVYEILCKTGSQGLTDPKDIYMYRMYVLYSQIIFYININNLLSNFEDSVNDRFLVFGPSGVKSCRETLGRKKIYARICMYFE